MHLGNRRWMPLSHCIDYIDFYRFYRFLRRCYGEPAEKRNFLVRTDLREINCIPC